MLLQLENPDRENVDRPLTLARQNNIQLSLIDETEESYFLPGRPLSPKQIAQLIEKSRNSWMIRMSDAHNLLRTSYKAD